MSEQQVYDNVNNPLNIPGAALTKREDPTPPPKKDRRSKQKIILALIGISLIVAVVGRALTTSNSPEESIISGIENAVNRGQTTPSPSPIPSTRPVTSSPSTESLYLGSYKGSTVIYRTDPELLNIDRSNNQSYGVVIFPDGRERREVTFSEVHQPIEIFNNTDAGIEDLDSYTISNKDPNTMYIITSSSGSSISAINITQRVYRIYLTTKEWRLVLAHEVGSDRYEDGYGQLKIIEEFNPDHLVLSVDKCLTRECKEDVPGGHIVINILSRVQNYHPHSGDFQFHPDTQEYTFRNQIPFNSGGVITYRPIGTEYRIKLP